tara:strand:- start:364 stop:1218 length:855 start_codon:yes stop_codon:yes gene_type:complete
MKTIIGIGTAGSNVVKQLAEYKQYRHYTISTDNPKTSKYNFKLPELAGPEEYDSMKMDKLQKWLGTIDKKCTVFLCGASNSSGITLQALKCLYDRGIALDIVYFMPEIEVLSEEKTLHERAVRGILQNYARSGIFEKICLVSNVYLENLAGSTNVFDYYSQINRVFTSSYYMIDVFKNTKPITSTFKRPKDSCRITTIGLGSLDKEDLIFFPFNKEVEVVYYCGINEEKLKTEENLFRTITNKVKNRITEETKVSFGIYPTQYENDYIYVEYFSPKIQEIVLDK